MNVFRWNTSFGENDYVENSEIAEEKTLAYYG